MLPRTNTLAYYEPLVVVVEGHGEHVESDEDHDDHVKLLVRHYPKDDGLGFPLKFKAILFEKIGAATLNLA